MHSWPSASPRWSPPCCNGAYIHYIYSSWNKMANMVGGGLPFVPTHLSARSAPFRADRVSFWGNVPRFRCNLSTPPNPGGAREKRTFSGAHPLSFCFLRCFHHKTTRTAPVFRQAQCVFACFLITSAVPVQWGHPHPSPPLGGSFFPRSPRTCRWHPDPFLGQRDRHQSPTQSSAVDPPARQRC